MLRLAAGLVAELTFSRGRSAPQRVVQLQWRRLLNRSSLKTGLLVELMFGLVIALVCTIWIGPGSASANGTGGGLVTGLGLARTAASGSPAGGPRTVSSQ